jgi:hypothetical protein
MYEIITLPLLGTMLFQLVFVAGFVEIIKKAVAKDMGGWSYLIAIASGIMWALLFGFALMPFTYGNFMLLLTQGVLTGGTAAGGFAMLNKFAKKE